MRSVLQASGVAKRRRRRARRCSPFALPPPDCAPRGQHAEPHLRSMHRHLPPRDTSRRASIHRQGLDRSAQARDQTSYEAPATRFAPQARIPLDNATLDCCYCPSSGIRRRWQMPSPYHGCPVLPATFFNSYMPRMTDSAQVMNHNETPHHAGHLFTSSTKFTWLALTPVYNFCKSHTQLHLPNHSGAPKYSILIARFQLFSSYR